MSAAMSPTIAAEVMRPQDCARCGCIADTPHDGKWCWKAFIYPTIDYGSSEEGPCSEDGDLCV